jgi:uncharacterized sulfatase
LAQKEAGVRAAHDSLVAALGDKSPIVRITAAEALGRFGNEAGTQAALDILTHFALPETNVYLSVAAWNALDYLDDRARPALGEIKNISPEPLYADPRVNGYGIRLKKATLAGLQ